jgi:hypothetical protein
VLEGIRQIEATIWEHEQFRFDRLVIQHGDEAPVIVSYQELDASLGPRPPGLGEVPLGSLAAVGMFGGLGGGSSGEFTYLAEMFKVIVTAVGAALLVAVFAFGLGSLARSRRRVLDESESRFFA